MRIVDNMVEVTANLYKFYSYSQSNKLDEKDFALDLFKMGKAFVVKNIAGKLLYAPSKFAGYFDNSKLNYFLNKDEGASGGISNQALEKIFGKERPNNFLLEELKKILLSLKVNRNLETLNTVKFFYSDENLSRDQFATYFICPTHIPRNKPKAWNSFLEKRIAAIGWDIPDYKDSPWPEVFSLIQSQGFEDESSALEAHKVLTQMKDGDLVCCTNNNHGLFGIGIVCSSKKYEAGIHDAGENYSYAHYVDVAWIKSEFINQKTIIKSTSEPWWSPYGTLKEKTPIPKYIWNLFFDNNSFLSTPISDLKKNLMRNLNTILYGPPGTGKTFNTINYALAIVEDKSLEDIRAEENILGRKEISNRFEKYLNTGYINFITFHQNYSYEEFVQGLRPKLGSEDGLHFEKQDGIFKKISDKALQNFEESQSQEVFLEPSFNDVFDIFFKPLLDEVGSINIKMESAGYSFELTKYNAEQNNIEFTKQSGGKGHAIYVPTLKKYFEQPEIAHTIGLKYYYVPLAKAMKTKAIELRKPIERVQNKNYVLIIDEINRANISRVFGELITLLEDDKRWGNHQKMSLTLPSGDILKVPNNLYLIGTMNTADKSIALLDIALRRRFDFIAMYPDSNIVKSEFKAFFVHINERVRKERGSDFAIGHAYLMDRNDGGTFDFINAMNKKIIPLLNEYFYSSKEGTVKTIIEESLIMGELTEKFYLSESSFGILNIHSK